MLLLLLEAPTDDSAPSSPTRLTMMNHYLGHASNPCRYGQIIEMNYLASEKLELVKHYFMGRLSHEDTTFIPDRMTVYMSDDDTVKYTNPK